MSGEGLFSKQRDKCGKREQHFHQGFCVKMENEKGFNKQTNNSKVNEL